MRSANAPIGVFDSGFGGLSVARALRAQMPTVPIIYAADCANAPWGDRTENDVDARADAMTRFLLAQGVSAVVIACNTATTVSMTRLVNTLPVPVFGIEPALDDALAASRTGVVATLATTRTVTSRRYQARKAAALAKYRRATVLDQPCPGLMECVERGEFRTDATLELIERFIAPLLQADVDQLILGCTHYPFLSDAIRAVAERLLPTRTVELVHPEMRVAEHIRATLAQLGLFHEKTADDGMPSDRFFATGANAPRQAILETLWQPGAILETLSDVR